MHSFRPRKDKACGLPNRSFIARKPKPLGIEYKCDADATTGVMLHLEIQEGKDAKRATQHFGDLGVTSSCTAHLGETAGLAGNTVAGDNWFWLVNVSVVCYMSNMYCASILMLLWFIRRLPLM